MCVRYKNMGYLAYGSERVWVYLVSLAIAKKNLITCSSLFSLVRHTPFCIYTCCILNLMYLWLSVWWPTCTIRHFFFDNQNDRDRAESAEPFVLTPGLGERAVRFGGLKNKERKKKRVKMKREEMRSGAHTSTTFTTPTMTTTHHHLLSLSLLVFFISDAIKSRSHLITTRGEKNEDGRTLIIIESPTFFFNFFYLTRRATDLAVTSLYSRIQ